MSVVFVILNNRTK